jgi:tetratricopeptide (TPR) repeat protein
MKRLYSIFFLLVFVLLIPISAQNKPDNSKIDLILVRGDYKKVVDTCTQILAVDTLNSEIYYKLGLAYQNLIQDDKSLDCFIQAATISPDNSNYNFTLAKSYLTRGKTSKAKPLLLKLCASDTTNWPYAYYLTSILMQEQKFTEAIKMYYQFYKKDYNNYLFADKIGFAYLRNGDFDLAIDILRRSLSLNPKNTNTIKNLAFLYAGVVSADSAVRLLTKGIQIDSSDMDLYTRRAAINFKINNFKKALPDYLRLINSGDSSALNLKRTGIGYAKSLKPKEAVFYLLKAYKADTADLETVSNLAQNYVQLKDKKNAIFFYKTLLTMLDPFETAIGLDYLLLAEVLKSDNQNAEAIEAYVKSQTYRSDTNVLMIIANLYDEKLKDVPKAIHYYEMYLNRIKNSKDIYDSDYTESVKNRIVSLKKQNVR